MTRPNDCQAVAAAWAARATALRRAAVWSDHDAAGLQARGYLAKSRALLAQAARQTAEADECDARAVLVAAGVLS